MQWTTPLWAETAGTSHSEDEEVSTSSAPLTKTYGGDGMRLYDQVILRAATEAQRSTPQPACRGLHGEDRRVCPETRGAIHSGALPITSRLWEIQQAGL